MPSTSSSVRGSCVCWSSRFESLGRASRFTCDFPWMSPRSTKTLQATRGQPDQPVASRLINCVCVHLVEIYFSIIQRKVLTPNDCTSLRQLAERIHAFGRRYSALGKPF